MSAMGTQPVSETIHIAVDAMGGDLGPNVVVEGVYNASRISNARYTLVGDEKVLKLALQKLGQSSQIEICPATQVIEMQDSPALAYRRKPDASLVVAARLVKEKKAHALISIGNTGGAMVVSLLTLGRIPGVDRPAIATLLPTRKGGSVVLLDSGATVDCDPNNLYEFALMGSVYAERVLGVKQPKVAILSNGEEESKGNDIVKRTRSLLKQTMEGDLSFCFTGNVEGRDIFKGDVDVVVCDGFVGNITLKTAEGVAEMTLSILRETLSRKLWSRALAAPLIPLLRSIRKRLDYAERGGAPLLGINGVSIIGHGRSNATAVANACAAAERAVQQRVVEAIRLRISSTPSPPPTS